MREFLRREFRRKDQCYNRISLIAGKVRGTCSPLGSGSPGLTFLALGGGGAGLRRATQSLKFASGCGPSEIVLWP